MRLGRSSTGAQLTLQAAGKGREWVESLEGRPWGLGEETSCTQINHHLKAPVAV
jgi:hypothetical protein